MSRIQIRIFFHFSIILHNKLIARFSLISQNFSALRIAPCSRRSLDKGLSLNLRLINLQVLIILDLSYLKLFCMTYFNLLCTYVIFLLRLG